LLPKHTDLLSQILHAFNPLDELKALFLLS
jgi:hypothetical protein